MWEVNVTIDKDKSDVGVIFATYTEKDDEDNIVYTFSYSDRLKVNTLSKNNFVTKAKQALSDYVSKRTDNNNYAQALATALNK